MESIEEIVKRNARLAVPGGGELPPEPPPRTPNPPEEPAPRPAPAAPEGPDDAKEILALVDDTVAACKMLESVYERACKLPHGKRTIEGLTALKPLRMIGGLVRKRMKVDRHWTRFKREFVLPINGWNPSR